MLTLGLQFWSQASSENPFVVVVLLHNQLGKKVGDGEGKSPELTGQLDQL